MKLSDAIIKRDEMLKNLQSIEDWYQEQRFGTRQLVWREVRSAIERVLEQGYIEYQELDLKIEEAIKGIEIEGEG
ncbi:hypothetical protein [Paenibacillus illinoisensis]|uniref:hypothetical protein n=1 Tax=Paenibacillus illinoisensis TaxID=59845 RepID=UPI0030168758